MNHQLTISLDAMGGDHGPETVIGGANIVLDRKPDLKFVIYGEQAVVGPVLDAYPRVRDASVFHDCEISISMEDKPSQALRRGRYKSGMWRAIEAVKNGEANVCISAGNTGALMAMSKFCLRTQSGITRPAMAAIWPTMTGESIVLDVGANVGADADQLVEYSVMGSAMARALFDFDRPSIGLLNIGVEEVKGVESVREAGALLREAKLETMNYHGFVEGDDLGKGTVDVVVTEGFAGNIALKTAEGTAKQIGEYLRAAMSRTILAKAGFILAKGAFDRLREKMDPRKVNGAVLLGLNGVVIKSHGGTDAEGFAAAIELGHDMVANHLMSKIEKDIENFSEIRIRLEKHAG
ncbi:MAG: phosphate acyltransferase PlsX [Rhizobiaceae bacterium]|jgi:glycerol-3-phosphate acyltransferase PlsX|nr:phosphate acyltransferase PlsX [Rhizobiaceae bacterium]